MVQLDRSGALAPARIAALKTAIAKVESLGSTRKDTAELAAIGNSLEKDADSAKTAADANRMHALAGILQKNGTHSAEAFARFPRRPSNPDGIHGPQLFLGGSL